MKTLKKIRLGLAAVTVLVAAATLFIGSSPARAATSGSTTNPQDIKSCIQNYKFVSVAEIDCTFTPVGATAKITVQFIDSDPTNYDATCYSADNCARVMNYVQVGGFFANGQPSSGDSPPSSVDSINLPGITVQDGADGMNNGPLTQDKAGSQLELYTNLEYRDQKTGQTLYPCKDFSNTESCSRFGNDNLPGTDQLGFIMKGAKTKGIANLLQFTSSGVSSLDGVSQGTLANKAYTYDSSYTGGPLVFTENLNNSPCSGEVLLVDDSATDSSVTGISALRVVLNKGNQDLSHDYPRLLAYLNSVGVGGCVVDTSQTNFFSTTTGFSIIGTPPNLGGSPGCGVSCGPPTPVGNSTPSCESSSFTSFEWVFCPILKMMDGLANFFTGIIENLLDFNTSQYLNPQVKNSWSIFKNIASALLVIIMLIAVISQAIGGGPVDAYTLRKILPRLVAAVIIIQISWVMLIWFIELANDLGHGVRDLISAPFGGWGNLDLEHLVGQLGVAGSIVQTGLFTGLGIAFVFSGLTIGGLMLIAGGAILTDFLAFVLLVLRQVFIVASVILFPIAIICWILPGTQKYWKLWSDNFIKLLMLFPLIMALIYSGRIFAHIFITATLGGSPNTTDEVLATFVMFIGFFGPYWLLPKTFSFGGQLFATASKGVMNATQGAREFPRKYALGAAKENRVRRGELRAARLADNPNNRSFRDRLFAGEFNVAKQRGRGGQLGSREMDFAKTLAAGEKESREGVPAQLLRSGYDSWRHGPALDASGHPIAIGEEGYEINKLDALQTWLSGGEYAGITPDAALQGHAFDTLAALGDPDRIRLARQTGQIPEEVWSKALARNFGKLNETARYLTLAPDLSSLAVRQFSTQDDDTAEELVRQLGGPDPENPGPHYIYDRETGGRTELTEPQHREALQRAANLAADARNPLIWVDLGETKKRVITQIEALATAEGITGVAAGERRAADTPAETTPPPPTGPGPEDGEAEIHVDHDPGT